jgi:hypothetical protein
MGTNAIIIIAIIAIIVFIIYKMGMKKGEKNAEKEAVNDALIWNMLGDRASRPYVYLYAESAWAKVGRNIEKWNALVNEYIRKQDYLENIDKSMTNLYIPYFAEKVDNIIKSDLALLENLKKLKMDFVIGSETEGKPLDNLWLFQILTLKVCIQQMLMSSEKRKLDSGVVEINVPFDEENTNHLTNMFKELLEDSDAISKVFLVYLRNSIAKFLRIQETRMITYEDVLQQQQRIANFLQSE